MREVGLIHAGKSQGYWIDLRVVFKLRSAVLELKQTEIFRKWRERLKDQRARALIASRLDRFAYGHSGNVESVGEGVSELRIHYGPGYRIYFTQRGDQVVVLLCGGDKGSQTRDMKTARRLANEWKG
ncbi:MAG: type II toxin-antitoxin system RelE/ParE family toxin [Burkholderiaceae bacterium]